MTAGEVAVFSRKWLQTCVCGLQHQFRLAVDGMPGTAAGFHACLDAILGGVLPLVSRDASVPYPASWSFEGCAWAISQLR